MFIAAVLLGAAGCQTMRQPISEPAVDEVLTVQPEPSVPPPETTQSDVRPDFEQESPKAQAP